MAQNFGANLILIFHFMQDKLIKTVAANYLLWPAAHIINFRFVPTEHRILYNNLVSVRLSTYLTAIARCFQQHGMIWRQACAGREPNSCAAQQIAWTAYLSLVSHDPCPPAIGNLSDLWAYCICVARQWRS